MTTQVFIKGGLAQIEERLAAGERRVSRQRELVAHLKRHEHNSQVARDTIEMARAILVQFELSLAWHTSVRDRLKEESSKSMNGLRMLG